MQHHSIRTISLVGEILDFVTIETYGETCLGILTIRTAHGLENCYAEGRCMESALTTLFPGGWKGQSVNMRLESHGTISVEAL